MNHVAFNLAIPLGSVVTVEAVVSRAYNTSMEVYIDVWIEDRYNGKRTKANEAIYTFVAVDETGKPTEVPELMPETELEKQRYDGALRRKQLSLVSCRKNEAGQCHRTKSPVYKKLKIKIIGVRNRGPLSRFQAIQKGHILL